MGHFSLPRARARSELGIGRAFTLATATAMLPLTNTISAAALREKLLHNAIRRI
jgi:hypothetical protein